MTTDTTVNELIRLYILESGGFSTIQSVSSVVTIVGSTVYATNRQGEVISSGPASAADVVIQAAINGLPSTGGIVYIKGSAVNYTLTASLTISVAGTIIQGDGNATRLSFDGSTVSPAIKMVDVTNRAYCQIRDIRIASSSANTGLAINLDYFQIARISNVIIESVNQGIDVSNGNAFYNFIENVRVGCGGAGSFGIRLAKNEQTLSRSRIVPDSSSTGIIVNAKGVGLFSCDVETGAAVGIDAQSAADDCTIIDCWLEGNVINLQLASGIKAFSLLGGTVIDASAGAGSNILDNGALDPLIYARTGNGTYSTYVKYPYQNKGTGVITAAATVVTITHGLNYTPVAGEITITPTANTTTAVGEIWIDTITSTQFNVNVAVAPGVSTFPFSWSVRRI